MFRWVALTDPFGVIEGFVCPKGTQWGWMAEEMALVLLGVSPGLRGTWFPSVSPAPHHTLSVLHLAAAHGANHERPPQAPQAQLN